MNEGFDYRQRWPTEDLDCDFYRFISGVREKRWEEHRLYKRELYLAAKARKDAQIKSLNLKIDNIPADVLAAIELDCRRYRETRIAAALRRIGEAKLTG